MGEKSTIEWTESTWNPVTGCTKISAGCKHCYAERMAFRLQAMKQPNYRNGFNVTIHEHALDVPLRWKTPQMIFVNSMSDLFHKNVPSSFIHKVFDSMNKANWHTYQVLTKRSGRLAACNATLPWADHIWMEVSVENEDHMDRIDHLRDCAAHVKFLSLEPLLGSLPNLNLSGIDWVIVGGESGPGARPMEPSWVQEIRDQCIANQVPFFFKQWGGTQKKKAGRTLDGENWSQMPALAVS